jgi:hypothetical protein
VSAPNPSRKELERAVKIAADKEGITERRLRRWIAASALIEVFSLAQKSGDVPPFLIKGGFALELRFRARARSSRDVDLVLPLPKEQLVDAVITTLRSEWSGFAFRLKSAPEERDHAYRLIVNAFYLSREWATFDIDLVHGAVDERELIAPYDAAAFGLSVPSKVPCLNAVEQIAQKLHAVTHPKEDRARDLIDIYLLDTRLDRNDTALLAASTRIFEERSEHTWPPTINLKDGWQETLEEVIRRNNLGLTVDEIVGGVRSMIDRLAEQKELL